MATLCAEAAGFLAGVEDFCPQAAAKIQRAAVTAIRVRIERLSGK
jgi:hypothetical protein